MNQNRKLLDNLQNVFKIINPVSFLTFIFCILLIFIFIFLIRIVFFIEISTLYTPLALIFIAIFITKRNNDKDFEINKQNRQEEILEKYLDSMERLLLNDNNDYEKMVKIARFKTLTVLRRLTLNPEYDKSIVLRFLYDTNLIVIKTQEDDNRNANLNLSLCDFENVNLLQVNLTGANLLRINLYNANLKRAHLDYSHLYGANLKEACLYEAHFYKANLTGADLTGADLTGADLRNVNLEQANLRNTNCYGANFRDANLEGANLEGANLYQANVHSTQLKSANNWSKAVYTKPSADIVIDLSGNICLWDPKNKEKNEEKIQEIKKTK
ncbi:MAG: pentapeptide repeat-containing protein [Crocosphaera sp.]